MSPNRQSTPRTVRVIFPISDNLILICALSFIPFLSILFCHQPCPNNFWLRWWLGATPMCWCGSSDVEYLFFFPRLGYGISLLVTPIAVVSAAGVLHRLVALARTTSLLYWYRYMYMYLSYGLEPWVAVFGRTTAFPICMMWVFSGFSAWE